MSFPPFEDNAHAYNPRTHSKVAEKEGFTMTNEEPKTLSKLCYEFMFGYVGNLDPSVNEEFIGTLFGQIGTVVKTKVIFDGTNDPYAFVEFADHNMAAQALQTMNRRSLLDREMKVNWAVEPGQQHVKVDTSKHFHVFVGDLSPEVDNKTLRDAFVPFGEASDAKVIRDVNTMKSKGYGFVSYPKREDAERAIEQMNGQWLGRRTIRTNWATRKPGQDREPGHGGSSHHHHHHGGNEKSFDDVYNSTTPENTSVYVGNIGLATDEDIRTAFESFGRIVEVRVFKAQGYSFVKFDSKDAACRAILHMTGTDLCGNSIKCSWGKVSGNDTRVPIPGASAAGPQSGNFGYGYQAGGTGAPQAPSGMPPSAPSGSTPAAGAANPSAMQAQQQYWQYYAQYYNNPQAMQQWASYWQQQQQNQGSSAVPQNGSSR